VTERNWARFGGVATPLSQTRTDFKGCWYARADSNGRPFAPEASARFTFQSLIFTLFPLVPQFPLYLLTVCRLLVGVLVG
jgi:hypothetical protein